MRRKDRQGGFWDQRRGSQFDAGGSRAAFYEETGEGENKRCREILGGDWAVSFGSDLDIYGIEESVVLMTKHPFVTVDHSRRTLALTRVSVSVLDMVALAERKTLLEAGDATNVDDRYKMNQGIALTLSLSPSPQVFVTNFSGKGVETAQMTNDALQDLQKIGVIKGGEDLTFTYDFGFLTGKIGLTLTQSEVIFFYEKKKGKKGMERVELLRVALATRAMAAFDELVVRKMPDETDALRLLEQVFLEPRHG